MGLRKPSGPDAWFAGSLALVGVVAVADLLDSRSSLAGAAAVAPLMASTLCGPVRTGIVSAVSLVVGVWLLVTQGEPERLTVAVRAGVLVTSALLAPVLAQLRTGRERRIDDLTKVAEAAQLAVLTPIPPVAGPTRLASVYQSASREALIGGDLYGVVETAQGVRLMIGDVRGKGIDAVRVAAVTLAAFRDGTFRMSSLVDLADHCDARVRPHLVSEDFVTALFTDIGHDGRVELLSCGHPAPMLARGDQWCELQVGGPGTPLGFPAEFRSPPEPHHLLLQPGDRLLLYTDGLVESRSVQGGFVPPEHVLGNIGTVDFEDALAGVLSRLHAATREVRDDLALLLVEYTGPRAAGLGEPRAVDVEQRHPAQDRPEVVGRVATPLPVRVSRPSVVTP